MKKLIALMAGSVALALLAPAPSQAAGVATEIIFVEDADVPGGGALFVVLSAEDPRCEHGRMVRYETRGGNSAPWETIGQEATRQTATAAFFYDPDDLKVQRRVAVLASRLSDGTQCKGRMLDVGDVRLGGTNLTASSQRGAGANIIDVGTAPFQQGSFLTGAALVGGLKKCRSQRLVILSVATVQGNLELARDTSDGRGIIGWDYTSPIGELFMEAPKRRLGDGTVCPGISTL